MEDEFGSVRFGFADDAAVQWLPAETVPAHSRLIQHVLRAGQKTGGLQHPLKHVDGQPYGNLYLTDKQDGPEFTEDDKEAVALLAEFAGVAVDRARRYTGSGKRRVEPRGVRCRSTER